MNKPTITYTYRGLIERPASNGRLCWSPGYSETGQSGEVVYPWMQRRECQQDAKQRGAKAAFQL
jgi:hypothetical protein